MRLLLWLWMTLSMLIAGDTPETVMIRLQVKPGAEQALTDVLARHYDVARRLGLVVAGAPHVTMRSVDDQDKPYFIEIFTWRSADVPDHAPAEITQIWKDMTALVESRDGHDGLDITPMVSLTPGK